MSDVDTHLRLKERFSRLTSLNPDLSVRELREFYALAAGTPSAFFEPLAELTEEIIRRYLASSPKVLERMLLAEYFEYLNDSARLLGESGVLEADGDAGNDRAGGGEPRSMALVMSGHYSSLDWCRVLNNARIPRAIRKAVDACQRRNDLVTSVVEYALVALQLVDRDKAMAWQLRYLQDREGDLDPDIARDLLNAWAQDEEPGPRQFEWAMRWSADEELQQQWPTVVRKADRLLCRHALQSWVATSDARNRHVAHLKLLIEQERTGDVRLLKWLKTALSGVADCVQFFVDVSQADAQPGEKAWRSAALLREIRRVECLFTPILLTADLILDVPDGAYQFAIAFFGLVGRGRETWEKRILRQAENVVRKAFLDALREGRSPVDIIERLTFGNREVFLKLYGQLDWASKQFDSVAQREKVVRHLAVFYASYLEPKLMAEEIARRYRNLMRLLHEDNLSRILLREHLDEVLQLGIVRELSSLAADARRFLTERRALESSLEEMVAAQIDFSRGVRRRRLRLIRSLLAGAATEPVTGTYAL